MSLSLFQKKTYSARYGNKDYDLMYCNEQSKKENRFIRDFLYTFVLPESTVIDLGCGTKLVKKLLRGLNINYIGVDKETWGRRKVKICDGYQYVKNKKDFIYSDVITATFSLDYMNPLILFELIKKCRTAIFTLYDRPYLKGSVSLYTNRKWYYWRVHWFRRLIRKFILWKLRDRIYKTKVCGEPYYIIYSLRGNG